MGDKKELQQLCTLNDVPYWIVNAGNCWRLVRKTKGNAPNPFRMQTCWPIKDGEGIEYSWAAAEGFYHHLSLSEKSKAKFRESVTRCLDIQDVLTLERQKMSSRRAHKYMVAYQHLTIIKMTKRRIWMRRRMVRKEISSWLLIWLKRLSNYTEPIEVLLTLTVGLLQGLLIQWKGWG
jgi:hypothetical protein